MADETYVYGIYDSGGKYAYADRITVDRSNERDAAAQLKAGGELRQPGDDGMHLIPRTGNGAKGEENLVAGSRSINRGSYKSMENSVIKAAENNPDGKVGMRVDTFGGKDRPDVIQVENSLTDKGGNVVDLQNESWTNQSNSMNAAQHAESGTSFENYYDSLTEDERAVADDIQTLIDSGKIRIKTGLDTGWQYHHFNMEGKEMGRAHEDFVKELRVESGAVPSVPQASKNTEMGGREREDGPGMRGRDGDFKGDLGPASSVGTHGTGFASGGSSEAVSAVHASFDAESSFESNSTAVDAVQSDVGSYADDVSDSVTVSEGGCESGPDGADDGMSGP